MTLVFALELAFSKRSECAISAATESTDYGFIFFKDFEISFIAVCFYSINSDQTCFSNYTVVGYTCDRIVFRVVFLTKE